MKAAVYRQYGPPHVVQIKDVEPPTAGRHEVLIRIKASTVSSEDSIFRRGFPLISRLATGLIKPKHPVLGSYLSGIIVSIGQEVKKYHEGDEVIAISDENFGAHAEYICLPESAAIVIKPSHSSFEQAVCISAGAMTALPFLRDIGKIHSGQNILIIGAAGSIGTAAIQIARYMGARVTGVCSGANLTLVKSLGAEHAIDYNKTDITQSDRSFGLVFDTVGKSHYFKCKRILKSGGSYLTTVLNFNIVFSMLWSRWFSTKRASIAFTGLRPIPDKTNDLEFLKQLFVNGHFRPVIDKVYSLKKIQSAYAYVDTGHKVGNIVLKH